MSKEKEEIWNDIPGFDGMYSASNLGRVRSEDREVGGRNLRGRVLKYGGNIHSVTLCNGIVKRKFVVTRLVWRSFIGEIPDKMIIMHRNKNKQDNRLENLKCVNMSESVTTDYKLGVHEDWGISSLHGKRKVIYEKTFVSFSHNGEKEGIICKRCFVEKPVSEYYLRNGVNGQYRHICKSCTIEGMGVKNVGALSEKIRLYEIGLRYCSVCKEIKDLYSCFYRSKNSFMGRSNNCKSCSYLLHKAFVEKRKNK